MKKARVGRQRVKPLDGRAAVVPVLEEWQALHVISSEIGSTISVVANTVPAVFFATRRIMGK